MKRKVVGLLMCFFLFGFISIQKPFFELNKQDDHNKILWSKHKLTWSDFSKNIPEDIGNTEAITQCEINFLNTEFIDDLPKITIGTFFIKDKSWTVTNSSSALEHEQLHFDIYELYARKIRERFSKLNSEKKSDSNLYQNEYNRLIEEAMKTNNKYDNEVYFNDKRQQEWILKINAELTKLEEFKYLSITETPNSPKKCSHFKE